MLESGSPSGSIDKLGLAKAGRRALWSFGTSAVAFIAALPLIAKEIDLNPVLGDMLGDSIEKVLAAGVAAGVAFAIKFAEQWFSNYAPTETK
jgi:hypothetical protein